MCTGTCGQRNSNYVVPRRLGDCASLASPWTALKSEASNHPRKREHPMEGLLDSVERRTEENLLFRKAPMGGIAPTEHGRQPGGGHGTW